MIKLQEIRQKQHKLEIEEQKIQILEASQNAVSLIESFNKSGNKNASKELRQAVREAKINLS